jgi:hypothetical protein
MALRAVERATFQAERDVRHGRIQRSMAVVTAFAAIISGGEAYSQHLRGAFDDRLMWTPVWLTPPMVAASVAAFFSRVAARTLLPVVSAAIVFDGVLGFFLHIRGIRRMPGGFRAGVYNIVMGPPFFAPLLLCSVGFLGLFASGLRRER